LPTVPKLLFRPDILHPHLRSFQLPERAQVMRPKIVQWAELFASGRAARLKERELLPTFISDFFNGLLGYTGPSDSPDHYTISLEQLVQVDGQFADAVIGHFRPSGNEYVIALEGKGPKDPLDRPFGGRRMSAVDQGYRYAINLPCDWIIVTSMRQTRLYHKGSDQYTYELFETERLASDKAHLKKFLFLLGAERVTPMVGRCHLYDLLSASEMAGRELSKEFYVRYANMREDAFEHLCRVNPDVLPQEVLTATQKLLDRVLFCAFSEDRGLLPPDTVRKAYEHTDPYNPRPIWDNFRGLFRAINHGNQQLSIPRYNGGLFADDALLDRLVVPDEVCGYFRDLADYDYRPTYEVGHQSSVTDGVRVVDVDILGHIFEQSITDLERLRDELEGRAERQGPERHKTRRKKEGAFYTPAFITRYIIEQTLGSTLQDHFEQLRTRHAAEAEGTARQALTDPNAYDLESLNKPQRSALVRFWEAWQDELARIRILDPACGSGAFLIEAFDQLHVTYQKSNDRLEELRGHRTLFDLDSHILLNNLYGVDLNEEAVEICKLSLWIKTAQRGKVLTDLDHNIRVGNSLVDDPAVDVKAFDWREAFPEVFDGGGFDVVVSNPPYIRQEWLSGFKPHWERQFQSYNGVADIFTYFYELGLSILREGGRVGFITSGSWVRGNFGGPLRRYLVENASLESMIDFGEYQPFGEAEMIRPTITVLRRAREQRGQMRIFKWLTKGTPPENLSDIIRSAPALSTEHLSAEAWELESDEVRALRAKMMSQGKTLREYVDGKIFRGILTGLNEAYVIDTPTRAALVEADPKCVDVIKPFLRGQDLLAWSISWEQLWIIVLKSSGDYSWPWSGAGEQAKDIFRQTYPSIHAHLDNYREALIKRQDQGHYWWELRACAYWPEFEANKIVWPDISKLPRFSMDTGARYLGNTGYIIPREDYYLLGVLASWVTWFVISKTAQPLRLRGVRWQYRLIAQFMERLPIPEAAEADRSAIASLASRCNALGQQRYDLQENVRRRLHTAFSDNQADDSAMLNNKAQAWWELPLNQLGDALKTSFKLKSNPLKNPRTADDGEVTWRRRNRRSNASRAS
jgi:Eco57I restriction-modification methylase